MLHKFKVYLKRFGWIRKMLSPLFKLKHKILCRVRNRSIQRNGSETLIQLQHILEGQEKQFFFDMGTLLGIVREGELLKHDMDVDIAVYVEDEQEKMKLSEYLKKSGCKHLYCYTLENHGIVEDSYLLNNIKFDVNFYKKNGETDLCYLLYVDTTLPAGRMRAVELSCDEISGIERYEYHGCEINIPSNAEKYLCRRYGESWRVPDKNYVYWKGPSTRKINETGIRTEF